MSEQSSILSVRQDLGDVSNLSLLELMSLLCLDGKGDVLIPDSNHHWFQGYCNPNVRDITNIYSRVLTDPTVSESGPSKDFILSFFKVVKKPDNHPHACRLHHLDGDLAKPNKYAIPVTCDEIPDITKFIRLLHEECKNAETSLDTARSLVKKNGYFIAPLDGLHRVSVLHRLSTQEPVIVSTRNSICCPKFVFVSSSNQGEF